MGYIVKNEKGENIFGSDIFSSEKRARIDLADAVIGNGKSTSAEKYFKCKIVKTTKKANV